MFDGHAGKQAAQMASICLHDNVVASGFLDPACLQGSPAAAASEAAALDIKAMRRAIADGFALTDEQVLAQAARHHWFGGAVCAAVWIVNETVFVANVMPAVC